MPVLTASLDDIVFEGRNRAYGAYQLRQDYQGHLASAGGITLGLCALVLGGWLLWPAALPRPVVTPAITGKPLKLTDAVIEHPTVVPPPPAAAPAAQPPVARPSTAVAPPVSTPKVVADQRVLAQTLSDLRELVARTEPAGLATTGPATEASSGGTVPGGTGAEATASTAPAKPFEYVEKMPEFAGGQAALLRYLREHLRYPTQALRDGQEGRVFMSFVVGADGRISDVAVLKGLGFGLDEEALRVVRQMPAWTPGYQAQHAVPVRFTLPITFKLQ